MFYSAAWIYQHKPHESLYHLELQARTEQQLYGIPEARLAHRFLPYNHFPYELILFLPLVKLMPGTAAWIWRVENGALLLLSLWIFSRLVPSRNSFGRLCLVGLAFFPVPYCLLAGQDTFVTLLLMMASVALLTSRHEGWAGAVLGLGVFKFQLLVPIIGVLFLCRRFRLASGFCLSAAAVVGLNFAMIGTQGMRDLVLLWIHGEAGAIEVINPKTMPNLRGFLASLPGLDSRLIFALTLAVSVGLLWLATRQATRTPEPVEVFAIAVCFVILVSFHTNLYDMALLLLPALVLLAKRQAVEGTALRRWTLVLAFCSPLYVAALFWFRVPLLAVIAALLWIALAVTGRQPAPSSSDGLPRAVVAD
jgi:hypothetical protein